MDPLKNSGNKHNRAAELRQRAEAIAGSKWENLSANIETIPPEEIQRILHELQIYQIELEMQNEELREAQTELGIAKERYFNFYNLAPVGYITLSNRGLILETNLGISTLLGLTLRDIVKQPISHFILPEDQDIFYFFRKKLFQTNRPQVCDLRMAKKDGTPLWVCLTFSTASDKSGSHDIMLTDITERKRAEEDLERERKQLLAIIENLDEAVGVWNTDGNLVLINDATAKLYGFEMKEQMLKHLSEYADVQVRTMDGCELPQEEWPPSRVLRGETFSNWELEQCIPSINKRFIGSNSGRPVRDANGKIILGVTSVLDITERKRAEEAVKRSHETFAKLIERSPFGTYVVDSQFRIVMMNTVSQEGAFRNVHPVIGRSFDEAMRVLWPEKVAAEIIGHFRHTLTTGEPYHSPPFIHSRHDVVIVEAYEWELHRMRLPDGKHGVICYYYDSTRLRTAEQALREHAEEIERLLEAVPAAVWVARDPQCLTIIGNRKADELYEAQPGENVSTTTVPEARRFFTPDGQELTAEQLPMQKAVASNQNVLDSELQVELSSGRRITMLGSAVPLRDQQGNARGCIGAFMDITQRKQAENQIKSSLAEKEVMLKEIHHRVKNNLQVISSLVSLQADTLTDERIREELNDVRDRVRSMGLVHEKLYQTSDLSKLNFAEYTTSLTQNILRSHSTLAQNVRLKLAVEPVSLSIDTAIPCGLILNELVGNALKHAFPHIDGAEVAVGLDIDPAAKVVCLRVRDNGVGLPANFDLHQSKTLGLRLVKILAKQVRGTVETATGPGTEFKINFPLKENEQ